MSCQIDLRGQRFGLLTVAADAIAEYRPYSADNPGRGGPAYWPCICDCGSAVTVLGKQLRKKAIVSCDSTDCRVKGLKSVGRKLPRQLALHEAPIGETFGRLTVLASGKTIDKRGKRRWLFRCICGTTKEQFAAKVVSGEIQSCGCLMREAVSTANTKYADKVQKYRNCLLSGYRRHATDRKLAFDLTPDQFFVLTKQPCFYCGRVEANVDSKRYLGKLAHNGVDRIDSSKGYAPSNCVACCKTCNIMKQRMSVDEFVAHIELVLSHMRGSR